MACVHCGEEIANTSEELVVWMPALEPDPVEGTALCADYAYRVCEERFQEQHTKTGGQEGT